MNIYNAMNTAKWALLTSQTAIEVTGQNISNVNNPDYNRQVANLEAQFPVNTGNVFIGTGVTIQSVTRNFDKYLFNQQLDNNSNLNSWTANSTITDQLNTYMNTANGNGLNTQMSNFFQGFSKLAANPSGAAERQDAINRAVSLSTQVSQSAAQLQTIRRDTDTKIAGAIPQVNQIATQIAQYNKIIHESETTLNSANDYRDKREALIKQLSSFVDLTYYEQSNGEVNVMMKNGRPIVSGENTFSLSTATNPADPTTSSIFWNDSAGNKVNITNQIGGGQIGGWLQARETAVPQVINQLDTFAGNLIKEVNRLHNGGFGIDLSTGNNFFKALTPGGSAGVTNTGTGVLNAGTVLNPDNINTDHYRITFDGAGNYSVFNLDKSASSGTFTFGSGVPLSFFQQRGYSISITGTPAAGDFFNISAVSNSALNMGVNPSVQGNPNMVAAGASTQWGDGTMAQRIADLQLQKPLGGNWSPTAPISSATFTSTSGIYTFSDFVSSMIGSVGSTAKQATSQMNLQQAVQTQLLNLRAQSSGVMIDEEMVNLIKYQQSYQASAKTITTVDQMIQSLLQIE